MISMPKIRSMPSREIEGILRHNGFSRVGQKGSHIKYRRNGLTAIVPQGQKVPVGTVNSIRKQSGNPREDFY